MEEALPQTTAIRRWPRIIKPGRKLIGRSEMAIIQEALDRKWDDELAREARKGFRLIVSNRNS